MMNKGIIFTFIFSLIVFYSGAQVSGTTKKATGTTTPMFKEYQGWSGDAMGGIFIPNTVPLLFYSFGAYPRYNFFAPKDYLTLSLGAPLNLGFNLATGTFGSLIQFMGDVPITIDFNIGSRATEFNESLFGGYIGGGLNYDYMFYQRKIQSETTEYLQKINLHTFGLIIHGGFRWEINGRQTGFRISYLSGFATPEESTTNEEGSIEIINGGNEGNKIFSFSVIYGIN